MSTNNNDGIVDTIKTVPHESLLINKFSQIPNEIIHNTNLSSTARLLLIYLLSRVKIPNWQYHDKDLMTMMGCGKDKLQGLFRELKSAGYVKTLSLRNKQGKLFGKKRIFADVSIFLGNAEKKINKNNDVTESLVFRHSVLPTIGKPGFVITNTDLVTNIDHVVNTNDLYTDTTTHISISEADELLLENKHDRKIMRAEAEKVFAELWAAYPEKKGRKGALEKFLRLTRGITAENLKNLSERIARGLTAYILEKELLSEVKRLNPHLYCHIAPYQHGETWFRKEGWDNDSYLTNYEEAFHAVASRPDNINRRPSRAEQFSQVLHSH